MICLVSNYVLLKKAMHIYTQRIYNILVASINVGKVLCLAYGDGMEADAKYNLPSVSVLDKHTVPSENYKKEMGLCGTKFCANQAEIGQDSRKGKFPITNRCACMCVCVWVCVNMYLRTPAFLVLC